MKAAVVTNNDIAIVDAKMPRMEPSHVLVKNLYCGICGSDLHFVKHGQKLVDATKEIQETLGEFAQINIDLQKEVFIGHEFVSEVLEVGSEAVNLKPGDRVVSLPIVFSGGRVEQLAYSNQYPAGLSQNMLLSAPICIKVSENLDPKLAALTEPLAVGIHASKMAGNLTNVKAAIIGAGPIGLSILISLKSSGVSPIVVSDFSEKRRELALELGADEVYDPNTGDPFKALRTLARGKEVVIFEAVGNPGIIESCIRSAPGLAQIIVAGVCMDQDHFTPFAAIAKELSIKFSFAYNPADFSEAYKTIESAKIDLSPIISTVYDLDSTKRAFEMLSHPESLGKVLIAPNQ